MLTVSFSHSSYLVTPFISPQKSHTTRDERMPIVPDLLANFPAGPGDARAAVIFVHDDFIVLN
jgi:hypothetical protein